MRVYLLATLDTKGAEAAFARDCLQAAGVETVLVDTGSGGAPGFAAGISRQEVFAAAGTTPAAMPDRATAVATAARGARELLLRAHARGDVAGVLALGGSAGTTIGCEAMRALPLGVPKVMVSTLASGQVRHFVGDKDILMLNSIVDIAGLNPISRTVLGEAAAALAGMVRFRQPRREGADRPLIGATMFGVTTPCVQVAREVLEAAGYEVLVFHATGNGGQALESLIRDGLLAGVLDVTTTELADELCGGLLSAGPTRLTAAAATGTPQVVSVGALDMVNFFAPETVPARYRDRKLHVHNANVTLMRTTPAECAALGAEIGRKLAGCRGPAEIWLPGRGISALDADGQPFADPTARGELFAAIRKHAGRTPVHEVDAHLNDPAFARQLAHALLTLIASTSRRP